MAGRGDASGARNGSEDGMGLRGRGVTGSHSGEDVDTGIGGVLGGCVAAVLLGEAIVSVTICDIVMVAAKLSTLRSAQVFSMCKSEILEYGHV